MASTKLIIRNYHSCMNKNGTTIIFVQYVHKGKTTLFSTGESIKPFLWDFGSNQAKRSYKGYIKLNMVLQSFKEKIDNIVRDLRIQNIEPVTSLVINKLNELRNGKSGNKSKFTFFEFLDHYIDNSKVRLRPTTIAGYKTLRSHLRNFESCKNRKINWETFNLSFYNDFEYYFVGKLMNGLNAWGTQIKRLKIVLNSATEQGYNSCLDYKHRKFKVYSKTADSVYLNEEELESIYKLDFSTVRYRHLDITRDLFIIGCYTGLRFEDFSQIKPAHIHDGFITHKNHKTNQNVMLPIHPYVKEIFLKYERILPKISNQNFNCNIKTVCRHAGINNSTIRTRDNGGKRKDEIKPKYSRISAHTARRSFITILFLKNFPIAYLMVLSGHKTMSEFMKYVKVDQITSANKLKEFWNKQYQTPEVMAN